MNRKSAAANLRKSVKPRESHVPGSAGIPSSSRRGLGNRTIMETTRNSVGSSRMSQYGQPVKKDPRTFNEEFIQSTFGRLRDFLTQRNLLSEMPTSPKLTSRQFESLFVTLMRCVFGTYTPPTGNNWIEQEVPIVMECLSYPQKVMKSTLQTVSSKVGPIMGIIDFLIDLAVGTSVDRQEAISLLSRDTSPNQFELQIEMLAQSTFAKGVTADSPHIQELVRDFCSRHKGIDDIDAIREEHQQVLARSKEADELLQALEVQQAELESVQEECDSHRKFIVEMGHRKQRKEQELQQVRDQSKTTQEKTARIKQDIAETRKIVDAQPISQEDIRRIRAESKDLGEHNGLLQRKIQETNDVIERQQGANRILQSDIEALCAEVASSLSTSNIPETMDRVTEIVGNMQESDRFLAKLEAEQDNLMKKISDSLNEAERRLDKLDQEKNELRMDVEFAIQDKKAADEKISFFKSRLAKKEAEILSKRQALKNSDNLITFADREVEDLKIQLKAIRDQLEAAETKREQHRFLNAKVKAALKFYEERMEKCIQIDRKRMEDLVAFYQEQDKNIPLEEVSAAILKALKEAKDASSEQ